MKPGQASHTAVLVCMARAVAHAQGADPQFADPVAFALLPDEARAQFERMRADPKPRSLRARMARSFVETRARMMVARTVAIDEAIRARPAPQVVILGAGLDGRAWRMPELAQSIVFEVDHPDSQREKRARAFALTPAARDVRFVPVDFAEDSLEIALAEAGHEPSRPTLWIWEGVVMYLTERDIEATLEVVARRSAPGSRLIVAYFSPALLIHLVGVMVRRLGEPIQSVFTSDAMRTLLEKHRFRVVSDQGLPEIGRTLSANVARATRRLRHLRVVTADTLG
jgi:methyltransferase (TIGR00027 family)